MNKAARESLSGRPVVLYLCDDEHWHVVTESKEAHALHASGDCKKFNIAWTLAPGGREVQRDNALLPLDDILPLVPKDLRHLCAAWSIERIPDAKTSY